MRPVRIWCWALAVGKVCHLITLYLLLSWPQRQTSYTDWLYYSAQCIQGMGIAVKNVEKLSGTKKAKREEQILKWLIFTMLTGLLQSHLSYIINHHKRLSCLAQLYNRITKQVPAFRSPVTLTEHHGYSNWNQTVDLVVLAWYQVWKKSVHKCPDTWWC